MSVFRFTDYARIKRRVSIDNTGAIAVVDASENWFDAQIVSGLRLRRIPANTGLNSPRADISTIFRHLINLYGPLGDEFSPGDRIETRRDSTVYEVVTGAREIRDGLTSSPGREVNILPLTQLYPLNGSIQEQGGGATVRSDLIFSLYQPNETHGDVGTYQIFQGEAPIDFRDDLHVNRSIVSGGKTYRIASRTVDDIGMYVLMELRQTGATS